jgi:hypothetical protein
VKKFRVFLDYTADWFKRFPIDRPVTPENAGANGNGAVNGDAQSASPADAKAAT